MPQGTGIKTYARALIQTLSQLGARVSVLWSYRAHRDPLLQEVLLQEGSRPRLGRLSQALHGARSLLGLSARATCHTSTGRVFPREGDLAELLHRSYFLPNCYTLSN